MAAAMASLGQTRSHPWPRPAAQSLLPAGRGGLLPNDPINLHHASLPWDPNSFGSGSPGDWYLCTHAHAAQDQLAVLQHQAKLERDRVVCSTQSPAALPPQRSSSDLDRLSGPKLFVDRLPAN
eukprot:2441146-Pleurochrysis_carterae.AAC.1